MKLRQHRIDRGWSQEQLAELSGVSARTIQRIENGGNAGLDTLNSLAAAFGTDVAVLTLDDNPSGEAIASDPQADTELQTEERVNRRRDRRKREFYIHLATFILIMPFLLALNVTLTAGYYWVVWPFLGWGAAVALHWIMVFPMRGFMDAEWEEEQFNRPA
ncbi:MAG: 2TM domain-containing protein [Minwuia sp.]|uniref:2TM domain-containing protein n=1 Tax=Minwuia sp. TaxID=2493630 RepID=UPI003A8B522B